MVENDVEHLVADDKFSIICGKFSPKHGIEQKLQGGALEVKNDRRGFDLEREYGLAYLPECTKQLMK